MAGWPFLMKSYSVRDLVGRLNPTARVPHPQAQLVLAGARVRAGPRSCTLHRITAGETSPGKYRAQKRTPRTTEFACPGRSP